MSLMVESPLNDWHPHVTPSPTDSQIQAELQKSGNWDYDIKRLDEASGHRPMLFMSFWALSSLDCIKELGLDEQRLANFLAAVESTMPDTNPYHNKLHVAGVVQQMFVLLLRVRLEDPLARCACIIAAVVHDCSHPGMSADLWRIAAPGCLDEGSTLEEYHLRAALAFMEEPSNDFVHTASAKTRRDLQVMVSEMVLATDMKRHHQVIQRVREGIQDDIESNHVWLLCLLMKVADLHHCIGSVSSHVYWVRRLCDEMNSQTPWKDEFRRGQLKFFDDFVIPMTSLLGQASPSCRQGMRFAEDNRNLWT